MTLYVTINLFILSFTDVPVNGVWLSRDLKAKFDSFKPFVSTDGWLIARATVDGTNLVGKYLKLKRHQRMDILDLNGKKRKITEGTIEVLKRPAPDVKMEWVKGTPGEAAPVGAVISGTKPDGTPLYVAWAVAGKVGRPGYYDPSKKCATAEYGKVHCRTHFYFLTFVKGKCVKHTSRIELFSIRRSVNTVCLLRQLLLCFVLVIPMRIKYIGWCSSVSIAHP